jgi:hypothetical protein
MFLSDKKTEVKNILESKQLAASVGREMYTIWVDIYTVYVYIYIRIYITTFGISFSGSSQTRYAASLL